MDAASLIQMAPEKPPQANDHRCSRPKGVAHAAAMAAAMTIFLVVAAACTALLLILVVAARASRRHRGISRYCIPSSPDRASPLPPPHRAVLSPADLRRLPSFAFSGDETSASTCAVCLEVARAGERWRAMPACRHAFHANCVDRWLATRSAACPLCRAAVTASSMG
ncbi:unnamed protein product [Urochloa humidicola]